MGHSTHPHSRIQLAYCRFPNGDFVSSRYNCRYSNCSQKDDIHLAVRSASTAGLDGVQKLLYYNLAASSTGYSKVRDPSSFFADFGAYDARLRPWFIQGKAAPVVTFGQNSTCWSDPMITTVYVWLEPLLSIVQAVYSNCSAGTKGNLVAVLSIDFDFEFLSETLSTASPSDDCQSTIVQEHGEVLAADDFRVVEPGSDGALRRLIVTSSGLSVIRQMAEEISNEHDGAYTPAQNESQTLGSFLLLTSSVAAWETYYDFIPIKFSTWSALGAFPREIFYSELDNGTVLTHDSTMLAS